MREMSTVDSTHLGVANRHQRCFDPISMTLEMMGEFQCYIGSTLSISGNDSREGGQG